MPFPLLNLILLLLGFFTYFHFRVGIYAYCRISKISKTYIRKNTKGVSNYWLYSRLHKQGDIGVLYYLNLIYLFLLILFSIAFALSWISFFKIPIIITGLLLSIASIPVFFTSLIYTNTDDVGKAFVVFKVFKGYNGKSRRFATALDWLFAFLPLALYVFFLIK